MSSHKAFDASRIAQCLVILDAWRDSALPLRAFATQQQHKYDQLRAWLRHEPRWRGAVRSKATAVEAHNNSGAFQRVHLTPLEASHQHSAAQVITIECNSEDSRRTARIHFPLTEAKISAQWLAAFMSA